MAEGAWEPLRRAANSVLERSDDVAREVAILIKDEIAQYAELPTEVIAAPVLSTIELSAAALRDRRLLTGAELHVLRETGEQRARQGVDVEGILHALRIGISAVWRAAAADAQRLGADPATMLEAFEHLWRLADLMSGEFAAGHRTGELVLVRREHQHRVDLVRALLLGRRAPGEVTDQIVSLGLEPDRQHVVVRGRPAGDATMADLEAALGRSVDGVFVPLEDDLIGLFVAGTVGDVPGAVGLSPPLALSDAATGFRLATRALATALQFRLAGAHTVASLGARAALPADPDLGEQLVDRFLAPLRTERSFDRELERTIAVYFDAGLRLEETARLLHVHPNTLRKRLRRYSEITGADLRSLPDQFGIWWALQRHPPG